ncbi:hypothetical protein HDK64DRAFT_35960 [Phyllosticta capitalensis]
MSPFAHLLDQFHHHHHRHHHHVLSSSSSQCIPRQQAAQLEGDEHCTAQHSSHSSTHSRRIRNRNRRGSSGGRTGERGAPLSQPSSQPQRTEGWRSFLLIFISVLRFSFSYLVMTGIRVFFSTFFFFFPETCGVPPYHTFHQHPSASGQDHTTSTTTFTNRYPTTPRPPLRIRRHSMASCACRRLHRREHDMRRASPSPLPQRAYLPTYPPTSTARSLFASAVHRARIWLQTWPTYLPPPPTAGVSRRNNQAFLIPLRYLSVPPRFPFAFIHHLSFPPHRIASHRTAFAQREIKGEGSLHPSIHPSVFAYPRAFVYASVTHSLCICFFFFFFVFLCWIWGWEEWGRVDQVRQEMRMACSMEEVAALLQ